MLKSHTEPRNIHVFHLRQAKVHYVYGLPKVVWIFIAFIRHTLIFCALSNEKWKLKKHMSE